MNYVILVNCKSPYQAMLFKNISETENMVYNSSEEAGRVAKALEKQSCVGDVRVVAI